MRSIEETLWSYIHKGIEDKAFEAWACSTPALEEAVGEADYIKIIVLDYGDADLAARRQRVETIREIVTRRFPRRCKCAALRPLAVINMGSHEEALRMLDPLRKRGQPWWWLSAYLCRDCGQAWLVAQEERVNDVFIMRKLDEPTKVAILEQDAWPDEFDQFERLLEIARDAGHRAHFLYPESSALLSMVVDLARERPDIPLETLGSLLNLNPSVAEKLARLAVATEGVAITFSEEG